MDRDVDQLLVPFAEREFIDIKRAMRILGLSHSGVRNLYAAGQIEMIDYKPRSRKRVRYSSILALCENLRTRFCIADRRPSLAAPWLRHRDEDLLPFPLSDTINIKRVIGILGYSSTAPVCHMIEEGRFDAYRLGGGDWRISKTSLAAYLQCVHGRERLPGRVWGMTSL